MWEVLTRPAALLQDANQRREARLLSTMLLLLAIVSIVAVLALLFALDSAERSNFVPGLAIAFSGVATIFITYGLSRTVRYKLAALLTVITNSGAIFSLYASYSKYNDIFILLYLVIPIIFSNIFLSSRVTSIIVILNLAGLLSLPFFISKAPIALIIIGPVFLLLATFSLTETANYYRKLREIKRQAQLTEKEIALKQANDQLENRVAERTAALQAANQQLTVEMSERTQVEQDLRESEERYRALVELSPEAIVVYAKKRFVYANQAAARLFGANSPDELIGLSAEWVVHPDFREDVKQRVKTSHRQRISTGAYETRYLKLDGQPIEVEVVGISITFQGRPARQVFVRDITERKWADEALRRSIATNRALLNAIPDLMFRISREGIFVNFKAGKNIPFIALPDSFIGKHLSEVLPPSIANPAIECMSLALQTGNVESFEYEMELEGKRSYFESRLATSGEDEVIAMVRDITERKQAEKEIYNSLVREKELNELKSRFITNTSHEFRTPLSTILSSSEMLEHYFHQWSDDKKLQHLQRIQTAVQRMTLLLDDILTVERADAAKLEFQPTALELEKLARQTVSEMQKGFGHFHHLEIVVKGQPVIAELDGKLLQLVLSNLLSNAIKYSPQGSKVSLNLNFQPQAVEIWVQDQGIGIPAADQVNLFEAFHRGSNVGAISGSGLGLAIVKKIVELHQGQISFESQVEIGTKFIIMLPLPPV